MPKYYTPNEANEALTIVRPMMKELMEIADGFAPISLSIGRLCKNPPVMAETRC